MPTRPWFPLNVGDYLRDTSHLSLEEHGAYFKLICHAWNHDGLIPNDMRRIGTILGVHTNKAKTLWGFVGGFWYETQGGYRQKRIDEELSKSFEISGKRRKAAEARHHANAPANAPANATTIHKPHSLGVPKEINDDLKEEKAQQKMEFEAWWRAVWWKTNKGAAERAWPKARAKRTLEQLTDSRDRLVAHYQRDPTVAQLHPSTWLNGERWTDELRSNGNGKARTNGGANHGSAGLSASQRIDAAWERERAERGGHEGVVEKHGGNIWDAVGK